MWRTLRMMPGDTNGRELAAHAGTESVPVAEASARAYLQMLHQAGYLTETVPGKGKGQGGVQARYRLKATRNTGTCRRANHTRTAGGMRSSDKML